MAFEEISNEFEGILETIKHLRDFEIFFFNIQTRILIFNKFIQIVFEKNLAILQKRVCQKSYLLKFINKFDILINARHFN